LLPLDSREWANLQHAYGNASDIPALLRQLEALPMSRGKAEPWESIWSSLAHQGDVYSASFAAVPHVVKALSSAPEEADLAYFQFPTWVEICRQRHNISVQAELSAAYFAAIKMLAPLVCAVSENEWDEDFLSVALAALAISNGFATIAEAALDLNKELAGDFLRWFHG
jgi:hypothetical protein